MNEDLKYLAIIFLILAGTATAHNIRTSEEDALSLGYCDTELYCTGFKAGNVCIGVENLKTECMNPETAEEYRMVEAECAVRGYNICNDGNATGSGWAEKAVYENRTCSEWKQEDDRITLPECRQISSPSVNRWKEIR